MCTKSMFLEKKGIANSKNWEVKSQNKKRRNKLEQNKENQHFFNSVCKHIKIEILTLQIVFPDKLFK